MEPVSAWYWVIVAAVVMAPCLVMSAVMKKLGRSWQWALLWPALLFAFYLYVVITYPR